MGQLKAGDRIRFQPVSLADAEVAEKEQHTQIASLDVVEFPLPQAGLVSPVIKEIAAKVYGEQVVYRPGGEDFLLIEYGPQMLDIRLRFRVHALMLKLSELAIDGIEELTPGIRSLQIHYNNLLLPRARLLELLEVVEAELEGIETLTIPARVVHLPLSWDDEATRLAIKKYDEVVRKDAPWCPDNIGIYSSD
ncbi:carboxyltransferase domain-containing protein [Vibrio sp. PP-XX7]